jgi:hypothetical protein
MEIVQKHDVKEYLPPQNGWYDTNKGNLYFFVVDQIWSCRDDEISDEYPAWWLGKFDTKLIQRALSGLESHEDSLKKDPAKRMDELIDIIKRRVGVDLTKNTSRKPRAVMCRQIFCKILKDEGCKVSDIAEIIGRDHSSVSSAAKKINDYLDTDKNFRTKYFEILKLYNGSK